jgi:V/A-type H+-transporting ATPase subunit C
MLKKVVPDTEFLYASARLRAIEGKEEKDIVEKMLSSFSAKAAEELFCKANGFEGRSLDAYEEYVFDLVRDVTPVSELVDVFRLPYDCQNIKMAIKALALQTDARYFTIGTLPIETVILGVQNRDFSSFPPCLGGKTGEAMDSLAATGDPQVIDFILDAACLSDMLFTAENCGCPFLSQWVKWKIDSSNLIAILRGKRMGKVASFFERVLTDGGYLQKAELIETLLFSEQEEVKQLLGRSVYADANIDTSEPVACEKSFQAWRESMITDALQLVYGPQVIVGYLMRKTDELRKARVIVALKGRGLPSENIQKVL